MGEANRKRDKELDEAFEAGAKAACDSLTENLSKWPDDSISIEDLQSAIAHILHETTPKIILLN